MFKIFVPNKCYIIKASCLILFDKCYMDCIRFECKIIEFVTIFILYIRSKNIYLLNKKKGRRKKFDRLTNKRRIINYSCKLNSIFYFQNLNNLVNLKI